MNENQPLSRPSNDEIDLSRIFNAIGNFFVRLAMWMLSVVVWIRFKGYRFRVLLIIFVIAGAGGGFLFSNISKPVFETSMLLNSEYLNTRLMDNMIENLDKLCEEPERRGLVNQLGISEDVAMNIQGFDYEPFVSSADIIRIEVLKERLENLKINEADIQSIIDQMEIENQDTYRIIVRVFDSNIIGNLEGALIGYIANNPYIKNRIDINKTILATRQQRLMADAAKLDSLKNVIYMNLESQAQNPNSGSEIYLTDEGASDPVSIYEEDLKLLNQRMVVEQKLYLQSDFEVVDGFTIFYIPQSPDRITFMLYGMGIFLLLGYGVIILIDINKYLSRVQREQYSA